MIKVLLVLLVVIILMSTIAMVSCFGDTQTTTITPTTPITPIAPTTTTTNQETPVEPPVDVHEHSYNGVVTEPTCIEQGYTTYICKCEDTYVDDYVEATGHSFGEWVTIKEASTREEGLEKRICKCGEKESKSISIILPVSEGRDFILNDGGKSIEE